MSVRRKSSNDARRRRWSQLRENLTKSVQGERKNDAARMIFHGERRGSRGSCDRPESQDNSSKITRRFSSPVTDSSRVLRLCQPSAGVRETAEGSLAERLPVRFGRSGRDSSPRGSDDANFIEKDGIRAQFFSQPALSSRRTPAVDRRRARPAGTKGGGCWTV